MSDYEVRDDADNHRFELLVGGEVAGLAMYRHRGEDIVVLQDANDSDARRALIDLNSRVRGQSSALLFVYYSGHGDADTLHLSGSRLPLDELRGLVSGSAAAVRVLVIDACRSRLRPILMTSFAFILGVVPLVIASGAGAEMRRTLGIAVFAGMLGVTLFGVFLTPVFFYVIQSLIDWRRRNQPPAKESTASPPT